jgi:23S rRNA (guanosine2251-2'-O)-methyltransferase
MAEWICGRNPVYEVLKAGRRQVFTLQLAEGAQVKGRLAEIVDHCRSAGVTIEPVHRSRLDRLGPGHQGVAIRADSYPYAVDDEILSAPAGGESSVVLVLDEIQDPQNLGALLRTAEAIRVRGVVLAKDRAASVTPAVVQGSSGATEYLQIAQSNIAATIERAKANRYWVVGLENIPEALLPEEIDLGGPLILVVGSEGQGMRRLVRQSCDLVMRLPIGGKIGSLNWPGLLSNRVSPPGLRLRTLELPDRKYLKIRYLVVGQCLWYNALRLVTGMPT